MRWRGGIIVALGLSVVCALSGCASARPTVWIDEGTVAGSRGDTVIYDPLDVDIPASDAPTAIEGWYRQTGASAVLYQSEDLECVWTREVKGSFTATDALRRLLEGTGLHFDTPSESSYLILKNRSVTNER
jgi:hypothetical protein